MVTDKIMNQLNTDISRYVVNNVRQNEKEIYFSQTEYIHYCHWMQWAT